MKTKHKDALLNSFLIDLLIKKTIKIEHPICSNSIAKCVSKYLEKLKNKEIKKFLTVDLLAVAILYKSKKNENTIRN